jgi:hypothetical protein
MYVHWLPEIIVVHLWIYQQAKAILSVVLLTLTQVIGATD